MPAGGVGEGAAEDVGIASVRGGGDGGGTGFDAATGRGAPNAGSRQGGRGRGGGLPGGEIRKEAPGREHEPREQNRRAEPTGPGSARRNVPAEGPHLVLPLAFRFRRGDRRQRDRNGDIQRRLRLVRMLVDGRRNGRRRFRKRGLRRRSEGILLGRRRRSGLRRLRRLRRRERFRVFGSGGDFRFRRRRGQVEEGGRSRIRRLENGPNQAERDEGREQLQNGELVALRVAGDLAGGAPSVDPIDDRVRIGGQAELPKMRREPRGLLDRQIDRPEMLEHERTVARPQEELENPAADGQAKSPRVGLRVGIETVRSVLPRKETGERLDRRHLPGPRAFAARDDARSNGDVETALAGRDRERGVGFARDLSRPDEHLARGEIGRGLDPDEIPLGELHPDRGGLVFELEAPAGPARPRRGQGGEQIQIRERPPGFEDPFHADPR
jgi:hypothetical protein